MFKKDQSEKWHRGGGTGSHNNIFRPLARWAENRWGSFAYETHEWVQPSEKATSFACSLVCLYTGGALENTHHARISFTESEVLISIDFNILREYTRTRWNAYSGTVPIFEVRTTCSYADFVIYICTYLSFRNCHLFHREHFLSMKIASSENGIVFRTSQKGRKISKKFSQVQKIWIVQKII